MGPLPLRLLLVAVAAGLVPACDDGTGVAQGQQSPAAEDPAATGPDQEAAGSQSGRTAPASPPSEEGGAQGAEEPQSRLSFADAVRAAAKAQPGLPAVEVVLQSGPELRRYRVTFLGEKGTYSVDLDPATGRVLDRSYAVVEPRRGRFAPVLRRELARRALGLADAAELADERSDAPLLEVAFQSYQGDVVIEVVSEEGGERVGRLLDAETGEVLVRP